MQEKKILLREKHAKKRTGIHVSETVLTILLATAFFGLLRDLYASSACLIASLCSGIAAVLLWQLCIRFPKRAAIIRGVVYVLCVGAFVLNVRSIIQGFLYTVDGVIVLWNLRFGTEWTQFQVDASAGIGSVLLWGLVAVPVSLLILSQLRRRKGWGLLPVLGGVAAFGLIIGQSSMWLSVMLLLTGLLGCFFFYCAPEREMGLQGILLLLLLWIPAVFMTVFTASYEKLPSIEKAKERAAEKIEQIRYGSDTLPEGDFAKASGLQDGEENRLVLRMDTAQELYLRGFTGGAYTSEGWETLPATAYQGDYDGMLTWLETQHFSVQRQYAEYAQLTAARNNGSADTMEVNVENVGASRKYVYVPAAAADWSARSANYKDAMVQSKDLFGASSYTMSVVLDAPTAEAAYPASWIETAEDGDEDVYRQAEATYHAFAEDSYLELTEEQQTQIKELFFPEEEDLDFQQVTARIRQVLRTQVRYTKSPQTVPEGVDFVQWFLEDYQRGNAVSYATAAVLAYRAAGYPARYAEGYYLSKEGAETALTAGAEELTLTTQNAHAWAEVYVNGMGWLPVEVVPGMYAETYSNQKVEGAPSYQVNPSKQDESYQADENNQGGASSDGTEPAEETVRTPIRLLGGLLLALYGCLFVYLLLEAQRWIRIRLHRVWECRQIQNLGFVSAVTLENERLMRIGGIKGDFEYPLELEPEVQAKLPTLSIVLYERAVELIQKATFGGISLVPYEIRSLKEFQKQLKAAIAATGRGKKLLCRYWYAI